MTYRIDATPPLVYLAEGASEINSIIDVSVSGTGVQPGTVEATEVLVIDCSSSMQGGKIEQARTAAAAAVESLRDGVHFAIIAGTDRTTPVYPRHGLAVSTPAARAEARRAVARLRADGGTTIGRWLRAAGDLFGSRPRTIRHAILLTDGQDVGESAAELQSAIDAVTGLFQCDCRGVGVDWEVAELRKITSALLGEVGIVAELTDLTADFERLVSATMGKTTPELRLRLWTPARVSVRSLQQVHRRVEDLTAKRIEVSAREVDYPTGAWGDESRSYLVCLGVTPGRVSDPEMLAARLSLIERDAVRATAQILARWTSDIALSTQINGRVAHYTGQTELSRAIQEGLEARRAGDTQTAEAKLGRAAQLAEQTGHRDSAQMITKVVYVVDVERGVVRLKDEVAVVDEMTLDTYSTRTTPRHERE